MSVYLEFAPKGLSWMQDREKWPDDHLADTMGTTREIVNRRAAFWVKHGVLTVQEFQGKCVYQRARSLEQAPSKQGEEAGPVAMEDGPSALISEEDQAQQVDKLLAAFIAM